MIGKDRAPLVAELWFPSRKVGSLICSIYDAKTRACRSYVRKKPPWSYFNGGFLVRQKVATTFPAILALADQLRPFHKVRDRAGNPRSPPA